ncbi:MAG: orotidine-5'-phosphate decarboxylase [Bacteroidales bacterium]|nr:orotidine-5'-phosphate decarboxylase [Bacteroidales bacterium]
MTYKELCEQIRIKKSYLCVGLDSDPELLPECLQGEKYPIFKFNREIIDATADYAVCYKPNSAFYEAAGVEGWQQLEMTVKYIKEHYPDIFVIVDAKRGDIGNTAKRYAKAFFKEMDADAVTLSPYMGSDAIAPFLEYEGKWGVILALTSNSSANDFILQGNPPLYQQVLEKFGKESEHNTMFVVGATRPEMLADVRKLCPDHFLLVPGVGAQGGDVASVAKYGMNANCGLLVNSSRGIIFASKGADYADAARKAAANLALQMKETLEAL